MGRLLEHKKVGMQKVISLALLSCGRPPTAEGKVMIGGAGTGGENPFQRHEDPKA